MMGKQNRIRIGKRTIAILLAGVLCLLSGVVIWYQNYYDNARSAESSGSIAD